MTVRFAPEKAPPKDGDQAFPDRYKNGMSLRTISRGRCLRS